MIFCNFRTAVFQLNYKMDFNSYQGKINLTGKGCVWWEGVNFVYCRFRFVEFSFLDVKHVFRKGVLEK